MDSGSSSHAKIHDHMQISKLLSESRNITKSNAILNQFYKFSTDATSIDGAINSSNLTLSDKSNIIRKYASKRNLISFSEVKHPQFKILGSKNKRGSKITSSRILQNEIFAQFTDVYIKGKTTSTECDIHKLPSLKNKFEINSSDVFESENIVIPESNKMIDLKSKFSYNDPNKYNKKAEKSLITSFPRIGRSTQRNVILRSKKIIDKHVDTKKINTNVSPIVHKHKKSKRRETSLSPDKQIISIQSRRRSCLENITPAEYILLFDKFINLTSTHYSSKKNIKEIMEIASRLKIQIPTHLEKSHCFHTNNCSRKKAYEAFMVCLNEDRLIYNEFFLKPKPFEK